MNSDAPTVDDFLMEQPEAIRKGLEQLRYLVQSETPEAREGMRYGGPLYTLKDGQILCGFTAQKNNLACLTTSEVGCGQPGSASARVSSVSERWTRRSWWPFRLPNRSDVGAKFPTLVYRALTPIRD